MQEIGVRELKASLSAVLRRVSRGEQVRVTMRGRAVADIVPAGGVSDHDDALRALIAERRLVPASRPRPQRPPRMARGKQSASALVLAEREAER